MSKEQQSEIWLPVKGYEGLYEVSDMGRVRSLDKIIATNILNNTTRLLKGRIIRFTEGPTGYLYATLYQNGIKKTHTIHRLVISSFIQPDLNRPDCNHKNGNKRDNALHNLEWCTQTENNRHAFKTGLNKGPRGELQGRSKLLTSQVIEIRKKHLEGITTEQLADSYNISYRHINKIIERKTWKHVN